MKSINCSYEILLGISFLPKHSLKDKVKLAEGGIGFSKLENMLTDDLLRVYDKELEWAEKDDDGVKRGHIFFTDSDYPESLKNYSDAPFCLRYRGEKPKGCDGKWTNYKSICIVGTREANENGRRGAFLLSLEAAKNEIYVYSGFATGIDQASHRGAACASFPTFAVMPCGLEHNYAFRNMELQEAILEANGGFISQFPIDEEPYKWNFHARNDVLAKISDATIVVQAPEQSGALITAKCALDAGKDVFVHKSGEGTEACVKGTQELIDNGAITISNYHDLTVYTLKSFKGTKRAEEISYEEIEKLLKDESINEDFYRFRDSWYRVK